MSHWSPIPNDKFLTLLIRSAKGLLGSIPLHTESLGSIPLHTESSVTLTGIQNLKCAVLPLGSNKVAMPLQETGRTISPFNLKHAHKILHINVFSVPPCLYRKNTPSLFLSMAILISSYTWFAL